MERLSELKEKLKQKIDERAQVRTKYVQYLDANPYKEKKVELETQVMEITAEILKFIPDKPYFVIE